MKFIWILLAVVALSYSALAVDKKAQAMCKSLHHTNHPSDHFANNGCLLNCVIHGHTYPHNVNENRPCFKDRSGRCHKGHCDRIHKTSSAWSRVQLGRIDLTMISATLANYANAYMSVCVQNSSVPLPLPISNFNRDHYCVNIPTHPVYNSRAPVWNVMWSNSGMFNFVQDSRINFEIFDQRGQNLFMGGYSLTIPQILNNNHNSREIFLNFAGPFNAGAMRVRVTWTPRFFGKAPQFSNSSDALSTEKNVNLADDFSTPKFSTV